MSDRLASTRPTDEAFAMARFFVFVCLLTLGVSPLGMAAQRPNVLFIAVDDMKVELNCYGQTHVISPNIDRLAKRGTLFERAYCQQSVCNPSRASVMTGMRPDTLRVWDLPTHFRVNHPKAVTLPQVLRANGYYAQCVGKIFHNWRQDDWRGDPASWSTPSVMNYATHGADKPQVNGELPPSQASGRRGTENRDVADDAYYDGRIATLAIDALRNLKQRKDPFFLAVGFWKPHLPFNAPRKYWEMYERAKVPIPNRLTPPTDVPELALTKDRVNAKRDLEMIRELNHGHLAAISYVDAQIGRVVDELDRLDLSGNTVIAFWSDHGLHLGEHGLLRKTTVFEVDAHVPMIVVSPNHKPGRQTSALVELLDIYPTLADLCDIMPPGQLEGRSLVPLLVDPTKAVKPVALTQTPRPNYPRGKMPKTMGYSIRSARFRYTEWRDFATGKVSARELYDHRNDPGETVNVVSQPNYDSFLPGLAKQLADVVRRKRSRSISQQ